MSELEDYEYGTWSEAVVTITPDDGGPGRAFSTKLGQYTLTGARVVIEMVLRPTDGGSEAEKHTL